MSILAASFLSISGQNANPTGDDYFKKGLTLLRQERYADALDAFEMSERLNPHKAETSANIGAAYMGLKKPADAIKTFQKAIDIKPSEATFRTAICKAFATQKEYDKAVAACKEGTRLAPDSSDAAETLIEVMRLAQLPAEQIRQQVELALSQFRDAVDILDIAANYYEKAGDLPYAAELYERLMQLRPNDAFYFARLADLYLKLNREEDAVASARRALSIEPNNPYANYFMGKIFLELGLNQDAGEAFSLIVASGKDLPYSRYYLAVSEERRGHLVAAVSAISEAAVREPENFEFQMELGSLLNTMARYEDAIAPLRKAVVLKPKDLAARAGLGLALFESANYFDGIKVLEETNQMFPGNEIVTMFLRVARARQRDVPKIAEMEDVAKQEPKNIGVRVDLVQLLAYARRIDEAEPFVQEIWKLSPKDVTAYIHIAVAYSTAGKKEKALDAYKRALTVAEDGAAYLGFASIYRDQGQADLATQAYNKVLEIKPDAPGIMQLFANHLRDSGKRREALDMYKRSLSLKPLNAVPLYNAAVLSFKLGDPTAGKQYLGILRGIDAELAARIDRCLRLRIWG